MIKRQSAIWVRSFYLINIWFSSGVMAGMPGVILKVESVNPVVVSASEQGKSGRLSLPDSFTSQIDDLYDDAYVEDVDGNGQLEVVFNLVGGQVNQCFRILHYNNVNRSLSEWIFKDGSFCNPVNKGKYLVSSYRDGAIWHEDIYSMANGKPELYISDSCVGCDQVRRKTYRPEGTPVKVLVSDHGDFEKRIPLKAKITSARARIFSSADPNTSTKKYLIRGDEITLLDYYRSPDDTDWAEFRFEDPKTTTEGWLRHSDIDR
jgi:hypothetical protein